MSLTAAFLYSRSINGVGKANDYSQATMNRYKMKYRLYFEMLLYKRSQLFSEAKLNKYVREMYLAHATRPIATGCGLSDRFLASPATYQNKVAILDGKDKTLLGLVENIKKPRHVIWVK